MKIAVLVAFIFVVPIHLIAHDTLQYTVRQYTDENGLPQNSVKSIAFDRSGFLWMITENGVVRFDGQNFRSFNKNVLPLTSSRMSWLISDFNTGNLYGVTEKDQVICMQNGQAYMSDHGAPPLGTMNFGTQAGYYQLYNALGLPNIYASLITIDKYKINAGGDSYYILSKDSINYYKDGLISIGMAFRSEDYSNYFMLGNRLYQLRDLKVTLIENGKAQATGEVQGSIRWQAGVVNRKVQPKIFWNASAGQAFLLVGDWLYLLKPGARNGLTTELLLKGFDFESNRILSVFYDTRNRRLFMGSHTRGLFVFTRKAFHTLRSGENDADDVYYAQLGLSNGRVLTPQGVMMGLHKRNELLPEFRKRMEEDRSSILMDHRKNIWVKHRFMLYRFDSTGRKLLKEYRFPYHVSMLYEDQHGTLFIGMKAFSAWKLNLKDENAKPVEVFPQIKDICYFQEEGPDNLWIGTSTGLYNVNKRTGEVDSIPGLAGKYIRSLYLRQNNELWITTHEDGYFLYNGTKLIKLPLDKGNYLASSHCILEDGRGFFWITTNKGLFQASRQDLLDYADGKLPNPYYLYYDKYTGFLTNEFNGGCQPCAVKLDNGYFSLPSLNGLVVGNPLDFVPEVPDARLFIDRIEVDGETMAHADTLFFDKSFDFIRIFITTPYFGNPYNRQLDFALIKDDNAATWLPLDADGSIKLSALASGTYEIRFRKANGFGGNNRMVKSLLVVVPLAFYETAWFRALVIFCIIAGFFLYMRIKFRYIRKKNTQLEQKIDERTQALKATLTELQQSEDILRRQTRMQQRLITAITHDIKTPLKYLTSAARRLYDKTEGERGDEGKRTAHLIYESGYRMYHLTDNLLQYIKLNSSGIDIVMDNFCLNELVENRLQIFNEIAAEQNTKILSNILPGTYIRSNRHLLGIVIHNLIDNAVKATFNGVITISARENDAELSILMEDNGFGMNREMQHWCNEENVYGAAEKGFTSRTGLGLIIVKDLVTQMKGRIHVSDAEDGGTVVELIFRKQQ
ncbi:MAG: sensor histidine kinase [Pseudobacter sp.]|uniref:sensor histidine kinase n=1 Tax=Pseudobacter sp. TaxID=2045420 RepID=UPI003F7E5DC2